MDIKHDRIDEKLKTDKMKMRDFTGFTKQERRGIYTFLILSLSTIVAVRYYESKLPTTQVDLSTYYWPIDSLNSLKDYDTNLSPNYRQFSSDGRKNTPKEKFKFDPNVIPEDSLMRLGFKKYVIKNLISYRSKGGKIRNIEKMKSIYGMDQELLNELESYIDFSSVNKTFQPTKNNFESEKPKTDFKEKEEIIVIKELNAVDSLELIAIKGIGPYFAHKILSYRKRLGGYLHKEQLKEVPKITDSVYLKIEKYFSVDPSLVQPLDINTAEYKTFLQHPYFTGELANKILKYRKQHGPFSKASHISRIRNISEAEGVKILPYLSPQ